jgi:hypothetical protein
MVAVEEMKEKHYYLVNGIRRKLVAIKPHDLWFEGIQTSLLEPGKTLSNYEPPEIIPKTAKLEYAEVFLGGKRKSRRNQRSRKTRKNHRKTNRRR